MNKPPFTKSELKSYIEQRGYIISAADLENMYLWYEKTEFCYVQGKLRIPLKNWRADVLLKCRNCKFNIRKKPKPKPIEKEPDFVPATAEQKAEYHKKFEQTVKHMTPVKIYPMNKGLKAKQVKAQIERMESA